MPRATPLPIAPIPAAPTAHAAADAQPAGGRVTTAGAGPLERPIRDRLLRPLLRVPLAGKLVGANALVAAAAIVVIVATSTAAGRSIEPTVVVLIVASLGVALAVSLSLVALALRPLHTLEAIAARVWRGDLDARVPDSPFADPDVARVGRTFNLVLDGLAGDRARLRALAAEAYRAGDAERARIGRELHDSAAQTLAAAVYQVSAARRTLTDGTRLTTPAERADLDGALAAAQRLAGDALDEVCALAQDAYPRVLDDLGLAAALRTLAHRAAPTNVLQGDARGPVILEADPLPAGAIAPDAASALYHAARHCVARAHAGATRGPITVRLRVLGHAAVLEIDEPDGVTAVAPPTALAERVALAGGTLAVAPRAGGTRVTIRMPLDASLDASPSTAASRPRTLDGAVGITLGALP